MYIVDGVVVVVGIVVVVVVGIVVVRLESVLPNEMFNFLKEKKEAEERMGSRLIRLCEWISPLWRST